MSSQRVSPLNMGAMSNALPDFANQTPGYLSRQHSFPASHSTNATNYQMQQMPQYGGQVNPNGPMHAMPYSQQFPANYVQPPQMHGASGYSHLQAMQPIGQHHSNQAQPPYGNQQYFHQQSQHHMHNSTMYANPYSDFSHQAPGPSHLQPRAGPYDSPYARKGFSGYPHSQQQPGVRLYGVRTGSTESLTGSNINRSTEYLQPSGPGISRQSSGSSSIGPSIPRGPPRKPKQSGHALWVGNLPPGTNVIDLKDHFSRDATQEIESVFLISKSNCAFVNYRSEEACSSAMTRFHDSRFHGVRLVCRLRRTLAAPVPGVPTGPAASQPFSPTAASRSEEATRNTKPSDPAESEQPNQDKAKERFFVVKSLTVEDLELSARNGIWATQAHNEAALNEAYSVSPQAKRYFVSSADNHYSPPKTSTSYSPPISPASTSDTLA